MHCFSSRNSRKLIFTAVQILVSPHCTFLAAQPAKWGQFFSQFFGSLNCKIFVYLYLSPLKISMSILFFRSLWWNSKIFTTALRWKRETTISLKLIRKRHILIHLFYRNRLFLDHREKFFSSHCNRAFMRLRAAW